MTSPAVMPIPAGTYSLGPANGKVRTGRSGAAAKAGHDLVIEVSSWAATLHAGPDPAETTIELFADGRSLEVEDGSGGMQALTNDDKASIKQTVYEDVLKGSRIEFRSTAVHPRSDGVTTAAEPRLPAVVAYVAERENVSSAEALALLEKEFPQTMALLKAVPLAEVTAELPRLQSFLQQALKLTPSELTAAREASFPALTQAITNLPIVTAGWDQVPEIAGLSRFDGTPVRTVPEGDHLHRRYPDPVGQPAVYLPLGDHRVDPDAAVVERQESPDRHFRRGGIDVDDTDVSAEREGEVRRVVRRLGVETGLQPFGERARSTIGDRGDTTSSF